MKQDEKIDTKKKIISTARELFAAHGFNGTSVRNIAQESGVNIAAVNYHFGSKEDLYWSVMVESIEWLSNALNTILEDSKTLEEVALRLFKHLRKHNQFVVTCMKTLLSDMVPPPDKDHAYIKKIGQDNLGMPGGCQVLKFLKERYPKISEEKAAWITQTLFSNVLHMASVTSSSHYQNIKKKYIPITMLEKNLEMLAEALLDYAKKKK